MASIVWNFRVFVSKWTNRFIYFIKIPIVYKNWWAIFLPKIGSGVLLELRSGQKFLIRPKTTDLAVVNETYLLSHSYISWFEALSDNPIIIDIGANIGDFSIQIASLYPNSTVYAVEPIKSTFLMLNFHVNLNSKSNIFLNQLAIGSSTEQISMGSSHATSSKFFKSVDVETVNQETLVKFFHENKIARCDLMKLDCEGAEWEIIMGSDDVIKLVDRIVMEYHCVDGKTPHELANWLKDRDFLVYHSNNQNWNGILWAIKSSLYDNLTQQSKALLIK